MDLTGDRPNHGDSDATNAPTSKPRLDQPGDVETLVLGRFLLAFNALDTAIEDAVMRYWNVTDQRFRRVFFYRTATGDKLRILESSPFDEDCFVPDCKRINLMVSLRNAVAHSAPRVFHEVVAASPTPDSRYKTERPIDLRPKGVIQYGKGNMMMLADLERHTDEIIQIAERLNELRNRLDVAAEDDPLFDFILGPAGPWRKNSVDT